LARACRIRRPLNPSRSVTTTPPLDSAFKHRGNHRLFGQETGLRAGEQLRTLS
jgi:hypothetical protein